MIHRCDKTSSFHALSRSFNVGVIPICRYRSDWQLLYRKTSYPALCFVVAAGNMDRHHYETFEDFDNDTYPMILDNGRGYT